MKILFSLALASFTAMLIGLSMPVTAHAEVQRIQPATQPKPICCKTRSGFSMLLPDRCRLVRGTQVGEQFCHTKATRLICCRTSRGYSLLAADKCSRARGTAVDRRWCKMRTLQADKVCCQVRYASGIKVKFIWISRNQCTPPSGRTVADNLCPH